MNDPTQTPDVESLLRDFIAQKILFSDSGFPYPDDASFLQEGIIDSLGVMELVEYVQQTFGIKVEQSEVIPQHFDSIAVLSAFVRCKGGGARPRSS